MMSARQDAFVSAACSSWSTAATRSDPRILEVEVGVREHAGHPGRKVSRHGYLPATRGIIGAVLGLMAVMQNLADPSKLATDCGVQRRRCTALGCEPVLPADRRQAEGHRREQTQVREMIIEGSYRSCSAEPRAIESNSMALH